MSFIFRGEESEFLKDQPVYSEAAADLSFRKKGGLFILRLFWPMPDTRKIIPDDAYLTSRQKIL